jgi:hypothetical protein
MVKKSVKAKHSRRKHHKVTRTAPANDTLVVVRGWMFVVAFALMLGIGAITGTLFNKMLNENVPTVAGVQVER